MAGPWLGAMLDSEFLARPGVRLLSRVSPSAENHAFPGSLEVTHEIGWHVVLLQGIP